MAFPGSLGSVTYENNLHDVYQVLVEIASSVEGKLTLFVLCLNIQV